MLPDMEKQLSRLKKWAERNLMTFSGGKMQALHLAWFETCLSRWTGKKAVLQQCSLAAKEAHWIILAWMEPSWQGKECFICHLWGYTWVLCPGLASDNPHRLWNTGVSPPEGSHGRKRAEEKLRKLSLFSLQKKGSQGRSSHCLQLTDKRI